MPVPVVEAAELSAAKEEEAEGLAPTLTAPGAGEGRVPTRFVADPVAVSPVVALPLPPACTEAEEADEDDEELATVPLKET